ncbi:MAG: type II toxin-antitoxin system RelE/ParE family toxin [Myxococcota bacterium]|nr:type II toxin-antitoxin system RelE/ParE family toxin [Myxococcota bacterium]
MVVLTRSAQQDVANLPVTMRARLQGIIARLERWPEVSGSKALKGEWRDHYRLRMGDWRVIFQVVSPNVIVVRIANRSEVYE